MKNIFDGKRFMSLLQKEAYDLRPQYLKLILIITCTFLVAFLLTAFLETSFKAFAAARYSISGVFLWGTILLAPFLLYKRYNHKIYGVNYFMLPASQLEKWLSMFFYCVIVTFVVTILTITMIDLCLYPFFPWNEKSLWITFSEVSFHNYFNSKNVLEALMFYLAFQSLCFLGNIWFQRAKIQKAVAAIIILLIVSQALTLIFVKIFGIVKTPYAVSYDTNIIPEVWSIINRTIWYLVAPIGLWIVSFMKMKEQQL